MDITGYYWILLTVDCRLKKKLLKTGLDFWTRATKTPEIVKEVKYLEKKWK